MSCTFVKVSPVYIFVVNAFRWVWVKLSHTICIPNNRSLLLLGCTFKFFVLAKTNVLDWMGHNTYQINQFEAYWIFDNQSEIPRMLYLLEIIGSRTNIGRFEEGIHSKWNSPSIPYHSYWLLWVEELRTLVTPYIQLNNLLSLIL